MTSVNLEEILKYNNKDSAIGGLNIYNIEDITAVLSAADKANAPIILQTSQKALNHSTMEDLAHIIKRRSKDLSIPICLHLDHAKDFDLIKKAIELGYSSVMYDGSKLPLLENIENTKKVVDYAHKKGVSVEGEVGTITRVTGDNEEANNLSSPEDVKEFIQSTDVDACAVSIGSKHAVDRQKLKLEIDLLKDINKIAEKLLVLHGSSGVIESEIKKAIKNGIKKINVSTRLKTAFCNSIRQVLNEKPDLNDHVKLLRPSIEAVKKEVKHLLSLYGSENLYRR